MSKEIKKVPQVKKDAVKKLVEKMKTSNTILIASIKGLPASQFQQIKVKLRGKAEIFVSKKSLVDRALKESEKGTLLNMKDLIGADVAILFSNLDSFELAGMLIDKQSSAKARIGDIAPEDIEIQEGPTELIPGPAISELGAVGLKVAVENGKLAIKNTKVICEKGKPITDKVSNVLTKLNILPMKVGFVPLASYDAKTETIYREIKIDKKGTLENLRESISKAFGFAVGLGYYTQETVKYFISKAGLEEMALEAKVGNSNNEKGGSE